MRVGHGYDVHRLKSGRPLILCGVAIPYSYGLDGHSDADVATHALMDALLGAAGKGDIGHLFPDSDDTYKDIDSTILLNNVVDIITCSGFSISNVDITIIAQMPKLAPYICDMREKIASSLRIESARVNVKATTEEGLGFTGDGLGISAHAVALLDEQ